MQCHRNLAASEFTSTALQHSAGQFFNEQRHPASALNDRTDSLVGQGFLRCDLHHHLSDVARTQTVQGIYTFPGLAPGAYQTQATVNANVWDKSNVFTIVKTDLVAGDTLRLTSQGDLYPVPNPVVTASTIYFALPDTMVVDIRIEDLAGQTVKRLLQAPRPPGINQVVWNGSDSLEVPVGGHQYWATLDAGADHRAQLLFR